MTLFAVLQLSAAGFGAGIGHVVLAKLSRRRIQKRNAKARADVRPYGGVASEQSSGLLICDGPLDERSGQELLSLPRPEGG